MSIVIEKLSYVYDAKAAFRSQALSGISLEIEDGDFFGVVGRTGSGKSTLIGHLNGLTAVQSGCVFVDGIDLTGKYDKKQLRAKVGMVFQYPEYQLFADTVRADVAFGPNNLGLPSDEVDRRVRESIALVGLDYDTVAERSPFELSGGQMRRVALAGIIAMKPNILVLDEPTAGLDPAGKKEILSLVDSLRPGIKTIIMVSHNMDEVSAYCNKIAVLEGGALKGVFTPEELFSDRALALSYGIELPSVTRIACKLQDAGMDIKLPCLSVGELAERIAASKGGGK